MFRDARDDGRGAFAILREHYFSVGKPKVIRLYMELCSLEYGGDETLTDFILRAETAAASLKASGEVVSDTLLCAMVMKGLPESYKTFVSVQSQKTDPYQFEDFKSALRSYKENVLGKDSKTGSDSVMSRGPVNNNVTCFQ